MKKVICILLALSIHASFGLTFEQVQMLYERKVTEMEAETTTGKAKLGEAYGQKLDELLGRFSATAKLDKALAVKGEKERIADGKVFELAPFDKAKNPELAVVRGRFELQLRQILKNEKRDRADADQKYLILLDDLVVELTKKGELDRAIKVRAAAEEIRALKPVVDGGEPLDAKALLRLLADSKWSWRSERVPAKGLFFVLEKGGKVNFSWLKEEGSWKPDSNRSVRVFRAGWPDGAIMQLDDALKEYNLVESAPAGKLMGTGHRLK